MNNKEIVYIAYKNLIGRIANSGFIDQFFKEEDYLALKDENLLLSLISTLKESRGRNIDRFLNEYFVVNKDLINNKKLGEKILGYLTVSEEVEVIFNFFGEDNYIKNYELMRTLIKNTSGQVMNYRVSEKMRTDEKLRNYVMDIDNFSLHWFDLPSPKNKNLILEIVNRDFHSYRKLSEEQRADKDIALATINRIVELKNNGSTYLRIEDQFYSHMPQSLSSDRDIAISLAKAGLVAQSDLAYAHNGVMKELMGSLWGKNPKVYHSSQRVDIIRLEELEKLPLKIFTNTFNIKDIMEFAALNCKSIKQEPETYANFYKLLQKMAKESHFVKEKMRVRVEDGGWYAGNIGETKHQNFKFFENYFINVLPRMAEELHCYSEAERIRKELDTSNNSQMKKMKI